MADARREDLRQAGLKRVLLRCVNLALAQHRNHSTLLLSQTTQLIDVGD